MNLTTTTDEMVRRLGSIPDELTAATCFGTPIERDGHVLIPVARVGFGYGMGFGGGSGGGSDEGGEGGGGGGGGGGNATPVAVVDITSQDVVVKPILDTTRIQVGAFMLAGWIAFWLLLTMRTISREMARTRRDALKAKA